MLRKFSTALLLTTLGLSVVACNTVQGAGRDLESAGSAISTAAK
ncbi:MAG: entericidin A/B family lipoprotein [Sphingomonadales bacterium]|nr:entericidin A/B family lipoprotein [Sphingomonadales bacterium]